MENRASPIILKQLTIEYDISSVVSTRVEAMDMLKSTHNYFNSRASTSGAGWSNWADGSLLTNRHILRTDDSATARTREVAKRIRG